MKKLPKQIGKFLSELEQKAKSETDENLLKVISDKEEYTANEILIYTKEAERRKII
jgi:hypothetical protein